MNKLENIYSLLDNIETALRKDIPGAPEPIADIPLNSDVGMDVVVEQMPAPSVPMEIKPNAEPSQEILAQHAVNSKDLTPAFNAWIPKIGEMVKKMVSDALTENGFGNTNPAPARMIKVVSGKKLIKVERSKKS